MVSVELKKHLKLRDLKEGKVFEEDELIIERNLENMITISHKEGFGDNDKKYDMLIYYYDNIKIKGDEVISINNNGWNEILIDEEVHNEYQRKLKEKNLW